MIIADLADGLPKLRLRAGDTLEPGELQDVTLVVVEAGLIVLRSAAEGSTRRTITCHAGSGALILPPGPDEVLVALTDVTLAAISVQMRDRLLQSPEAARVLV